MQFGTWTEQSVSTLPSVGGGWLLLFCRLFGAQAYHFNIPAFGNILKRKKKKDRQEYWVRPEREGKESGRCFSFWLLPFVRDRHGGCGFLSPWHRGKGRNDCGREADTECLVIEECFLCSFE